MPRDLLTSEEPAPAPVNQPKDLLEAKPETKTVSDAEKLTQVVGAAPPAMAPDVKQKMMQAQGYDPDVDYGFDPSQPPAEKTDKPGWFGLMDIPNLAKRAGKSLERAFVEGGAFKQRDPGELSPENIKKTLDFHGREVKKLPAQIALQRSDNPDEAKLALEQIYGPGNVGQDKGGRWWAKIGGKKQAIFGGGKGAGLEKFVSGAAATTPSMAGSMAAERAFGIPAAGETMGLSLPLAWFGGGAVGKGADEVIKSIQGVHKKTASEEEGVLAGAGATNVAAFGLPSAVAKTIKGAANVLPKYLAGVSDKGRAMVNDLLKLGPRPQGLGQPGYMPPLATATPGLKAAQYDQMVRNLVAGDPKVALNVAKMKRETVQMLRESGVPNDKVYPLLKQLTEKTEAISTSSEGEAVTKFSKAVKEGLQKEGEKSLKVAKDLAESTVSVYRKLADTAKPVAKESAAAISQARQNVSQAFSLAYNHVDHMTEGKPFASLSFLKNKIYELTRNIPPDSVPVIYKNILGMNEADVSIMKMHEIRSSLRNEASTSNLTPGAREFRYGEAADMADASLKQAERSLKGTKYENAIPFMRQVDTEYAKAIAPFKNDVVNKLVQDMKDGLEPNPEVTANIIGEVGHDAQTKFIMKNMNPELRRKVGAAYMKGIFNDAEKMTGGNEFMTSGRALLKTVNERGSAMEEIYGPVYGKDFVPKVKEAIKQLAAVDGSINIKTLEERLPGLKPGGVLDALNEHLANIKKIDEFAKNNPLALLASDNPMVIDRALRTIIKPGDESTLAFAAHSLDPAGKEWKMVQDFALKDILSKAFQQTSAGIDVITGKSLKDALKSYTAEQQKLLFPGDTLEKLAKIADKSDFLFPFTPDDFGGSLKAASIKGGIPFHGRSNWAYLWYKFYGWLADKPSVLNYLVNGLENPNMAERVQARTMVQQLFKYSLVEQEAGPGSGKPKQ